jgi:putative phosphoesterase
MTWATICSLATLPTWASKSVHLKGSVADPLSLVVGVLSDTHGHLYPQVREILAGVDHIIHAGDIGSPDVLAGLRALAPVTAVRGNCDLDRWAQILPVEAEVELAGIRILVGHIAGRLRERLAREQNETVVTPSAGGASHPGLRVVISGHTHRVESEERNGILHLNPGSAGPERFGHPRTLARLHMTTAASEAGAGEPDAALLRVEFLIVPESGRR